MAANPNTRRATVKGSAFTSIATDRRKSLASAALAISITLGYASPAQAETINLLCSYSDSDRVLHVFVDTDLQTTYNTLEDQRYGPFTVSISDTTIRWTEPAAEGGERQYTIDRVAGTIRTLHYRGKLILDQRGPCRRATQKF